MSPVFINRQEVILGAYVGYVLASFQRMNGEWWVIAETDRGTPFLGPERDFRAAQSIPSIMGFFRHADRKR